MKDITIFSRVTSKEKVFFARQLAVMISAGLAIDQALTLLKAQTKNITFKNVIGQLYQDIQAGEALSVAMNKHPKVFDRVTIAVVRSGEAAGKMDRVLTHLADRMESFDQFKSKIRSALAYPIFILASMIVAVVILMWKVIPILESVFAESNVPLPWTTRAIIWISRTMISYWWLIILVIVVVVVGTYLFFTKTARGRYYWDVVKLKSPIVRYIAYDMYMARFARTLSMLIASGIPIIETIKITSSSVNNRVFTRIFKGVVMQVEKGVPMSVPLEKAKEVPILVSQMVMVGEQTGRMETMMDKLAGYYEEQVDTKLKTLTSLVEPVVIVIIGLGVGFLIYSILYPIYSLVQVI